MDILGGLIITTESQNLPFALPALRSPQGERWVSDFDIRISDFNHSGCFMQNKANFLEAKMNITFFPTKYYENKIAFGLPKNKPNTNPKQTQFPKSQNECKLSNNKEL